MDDESSKCFSQQRILFYDKIINLESKAQLPRFINIMEVSICESTVSLWLEQYMCQRFGH